MSIETRTDTSQDTGQTLDRDTLYHKYFEASVEETLRSCLDEIGMKRFHDKIDELGFIYKEILEDPYLFQEAIYSIFPGLVEMPAPLFLRVVLINLCKILNVKCDKNKRYNFTMYFQELHNDFVGVYKK